MKSGLISWLLLAATAAHGQTSFSSLSVTGTLGIPTAPTVTVVGTSGSTTYIYYVIAKGVSGNRSLSSAPGIVTNGNATLSSTNYNAITWTAVSGASSYDILKNNPLTLLGNATATTLNDTGQSTSAYAPPVVNETGTLTSNVPAYFGGNSPWVDVRLMGAKGDGATDDTVAIQSAVTAVENAGGGVVYFPPGTYKFNGSLTLSGASGVNWTVLLVNGTLAPTSTLILDANRHALIGVGGGVAAFGQAENTASIAPGTLNPVLKVNATSATAIRNLSISGCTVDCIMLKSTSNTVLENVVAETSASGTGNALHLQDAITMRAIRSTFNGPSGAYPRTPAIFFEGVSSQIANHWLDHINMNYSGVKIKCAAAQTCVNFIFKNFQLENFNSEFLTVDSTLTQTSGITIDGLWSADSTGTGAQTMIKTTGVDSNHSLLHVRISNFDSYSGPLVNVTAGPAIKGLQIYNSGLGTEFPSVGQGNFDFTFYPDSITFAPRSGVGFGSPLAIGLQTVGFSTNPTFDASKGNGFKITLTGNVTSSTLSNQQMGQILYFLICQDATGGWTFAWPGTFLGAMTVGTTANKCSGQALVWDAGANHAYAITPGVTNQ